MKRSVAALAFAAALVLGSAAMAARAAEAPADQASILPDVVVEAVAVDPASVGAGQTLRGTATVSNPSEYPAEATYDLALVGSFDENGLPSTVYAKRYSVATFSLAPGERAQVPFSLDVPAGISATGASVEFQARLVGSVYVGWGYSDPLSIVGTGGFATVEAAYFTLANGDEVAHSAGPTLYPDAPRDQLPLTVLLHGHGADLSLAPVVTEANRGIPGAAAESRRLEPVAVPASGVATATVPVAYGSREPGIYEGEVAWVDARGIERAPRLGFRYILAGQTATVHSVSSSAGSVSVGQDFRVTLAVSGVPVDLASADKDRDGPSPVTVTVEISDANGAIASGSETEVLPPLGQISFDLTAARAASSMTAKVTVVDGDGEEIFGRSYPLEAGKTDSGADAAARAKLLFSVASIVAAALLVGAGLSWRRFRRRAALGMVLAAAAVWAFACYSVASATGGNVTLIYNSVSVGWIEGCTGPNLYVNNPPPAGFQTCGALLQARARVQYSYCANSSNYGSSHIWFEKNGIHLIEGMTTSNAYDGSSGNHGAAYYNGLLALPVSGAYFNQNGGGYGVGVSDAATLGGDGCSWSVAGVRYFSVVGCDLCLNVSGVQETIPSWVARDAAGICDQCPNTDGTQGDLQSWVTQDASGNCDLCPNIDGTQGNLLPGMAQDASGNCDQCLNVSGLQVSLPQGLVREAAGSCIVPDECPNIAGPQNTVPVDMVKNTSGECVCNSGTVLNAATGRCEGGTCTGPNCSTCTGANCDNGGGTDCPIGQDYCGGRCCAGVCCNGACQPNGTSCAPTTCPIETAGDQYCVQVYGATGALTDRVSSLSFTQLLQAFGAGLSIALEEQRFRISSGFVAQPIWGVVGRSVLGANEGSAGCAATVCTYGAAGCLTTTSAGGQTVAACDPATGVDPNAGAPQAILEVEPSVIGRGGSCEVYWSSRSMASCQVSGQGVSSTALAGRAETPSLQATAVYTFNCVGLNGQTYSDVDQCAVDPNVVEF